MLRPGPGPRTGGSEPGRSTALPPGPGAASWRMTMAFMRDRSRLVPRLHEQYGDTFTIGIHPGPRDFVIFSDPADVKAIFASDPAEFHAGKGNEILKPVMGRHSVLLTDDLEHQRARKLLMPAFTGPAMRGYVPVVEAIAKAEVDSWHDGQRLVTLDRMNAVTLDVILQVVFGVTDERRLDVLRPKVNRMVDIDARILLSWLMPRLRRVPPWRGYFRNQREVDELLYAEIAERRGARDLKGRTDVLSRLLGVGEGGGGEGAPATNPSRGAPPPAGPPTHGDDQAPGRDAGASAAEKTEPLSDVELRDQLVTLLLAGHETTASALSWTLHELGRDPRLRDRAVQAAETGDDAFLEACLKESMRLHPIIDFVARTLQSDQVVGGYHLPAGVTVAPSIMLSHSREESFADAHEFRPDRFLDAKPAPNTWIPFGGGVRRCIGAAFSLMEGTVVLREVLQRFDVHTERPTGPRLRNITNVPDDKAPVVLRRR